MINKALTIVSRRAALWSAVARDRFGFGASLLNRAPFFADLKLSRYSQSGKSRFVQCLVCPNPKRSRATALQSAARRDTIVRVLWDGCSTQKSESEPLILLLFLS